MSLLGDSPSRFPSAPPAEQAPTTFSERVSAGFNRQHILTDAFNYRNRIRNDILADQGQQAFGDPNAAKTGVAGPRAEGIALDRYFAAVNRAAFEEPERFGPIAKNRQELENLVTAELRRQLEEADRILRNAPGGAFAAQTLGELGRAATDEAGLTTNLLGLGVGSALRLGFLGTVALEASLGAGAEAMTLPAQFEVAEDLDISDPRVVEQLLLSAGGGALFPIAARILATGLSLTAGTRGAMDRMGQADAAANARHGLDAATHEAGETAAGRAVDADDPDALPDFTDRAPDSAFRAQRDGSGLDSLGSDYENLLASLIFRESRGNPALVGPIITKGPNKGDRAYGLGQVMPRTALDPGFGLDNVFEVARSMRVEVGEETKAEAIRLLLNPRVNHRFTDNYLRAMLRKFDGDTEAALIAYNAGSDNAQRFLDAGRDFEVLPDRAQTEPYAADIIARAIGPEDTGQGFNASPRRFRVDELETDAPRYQFKDSLGPDGRTGALGDAPYDEDLAGLLLVHERRDGRRIIVNGHERFAAARAAGPDARVNAIVLREADGWTESAVLARSGILDYLEGRVDPARVTAALRRRAVLDEARLRKPDLFERLGAAEERLRKIEGGFDAARLRRFSDRVDRAKTKKQREKAAKQLETQAETVQELNRARSDRARLLAERNRLLGQVERDLPRPPSNVRPKDARQAIKAEGDTSPEAAAIFAAAPERGIRATVKDIAAHVRGRVPEGARRRIGDDAGRARPPAETRVSEVAPQRAEEFSDPDGAAAVEGGHEAMRELQRVVAESPEAIEVAPGMTDRQALGILERNDEFLKDLDACPTGRAT